MSYFPPQSYYDITQMRSVPIRSIVGQVQFYLKPFLSAMNAPGEELLLARYANTISMEHGQLELDHLAQLTQHLVRRGYEKCHGYVDPLVAREVEREIVLRQMPEDYANGYDVKPATRLLAEYERNGPVFTQPERNLLFRFQYCTGDRYEMGSIARAFCDRSCTEQDIINICQQLERTELEWCGLDSMEGLRFLPTKAPGTPLDLRDSEDPMKQYPPFTLYSPQSLPPGSIVLQNGTLLKRTETGFWHSDHHQIDGTYTAPHFFKRAGKDGFGIADKEYQELFCHEQEESMADEMSMGSMPM